MDKHNTLRAVVQLADDCGVIPLSPFTGSCIEEFARRLRAEGEKEQGLTRHEFYKDGDKDVPEQIKDRNGQVVLTLCKLCNQAEGELKSDYCPQPTESRAEWEREQLTTEEIREYTERAATAIGKKWQWFGAHFHITTDWDEKLFTPFDPAHNDADSRRLARTLRIDVRFGKNRVSAWSDELGGQVTRYEPNATLDQIGAAERMAVLRVAGRE